MKNVKWIFNPLMIWGAVLGFLIFAGLGKIQDTSQHRGSGYVTYEQPDRTVKMAESQYKRHEYATGGTMLALGVFLWIVVARVAKNDAAKAAAREDYLNARIEALAAYERAFSAALDRTSYEEAANQAMMSPGYKSAKSTEDAKRSAYSVASKATEAE